MAEESQVYRVFEALWMQYEWEMWDVMGPDDEASYPSPVDSLPPKGKECSVSARA
jgi:hypothetical protein